MPTKTETRLTPGGVEQPERLLSTRKVSAILDINENDVRVLIRHGKLAAKHQVCRGKKGRPRLYVLLSEVERYIRDLPGPMGRTAEPRSVAPAKPQSRRVTSSGVIEFV